MKQRVNKVYEPLFRSQKRYTILMGGRGAGRSTVASQFANSNLISDEYFRCAIMRYILGDVRNSIYQEIKDRAEENEISEALSINDSMMTIKYGQNTINAVGFKKSSGDQRSKLKSLANYNCVIIEEADEIPEEDFMQLDDSLRTLKGDIRIILLLNPPPKTHWIIERWFELEKSGIKDFYIPKLKAGLEKDTEFIYTNFNDNIINLDPQSVTNYNRYKETKPAHYYNMIVGYVPETVKGKIYSNWEKIPSVPHEARLERYGLDFGYSNDPTAIVAVYRYNGGIILDEIIYQTGMRNSQIMATLQNVESALVIADSSEPKSIDEIKLGGLMVLPSEKGSDSIKKGIDVVQDEKIWVTERSSKIWLEYLNYAWMDTKEGDIINTPKPGYDHAMDAIRYAITSLGKKKAWKPNDPGGVKPHIAGTLA